MSHERHISTRKSKSWDDDFAEEYINLRQKEGRLYSDNEVMLLPDMATRAKSKEWKVRKNSCQRLLKYLTEKSRPLKILEVGCGNGWFANQLAQVPGADVTGMDINLHELNQASRVFVQTEKLQFIYGDLRTEISGRFDIIVFASSIQYFSSPGEIIHAALGKLQLDGEVHLLDTHIYEPSKVQQAQSRSTAYFREIGFEKMARFYFHHSFEDLQGFRSTVLYNPQKFWNRLLKKNPFHWVCITPRE
jgi:ubiquinone/menaquinone biosynthesis C-methylase UbiE